MSQYQGLQNQKKIVLLLDTFGIVMGIYFTGTWFYFLIFTLNTRDIYYYYILSYLL